jgi:hypothetical protein
MPTPTYTPLATVTLGTAASSVTFSSIPATYRDLIIVVNGRSTHSANNLDTVGGRFNGDAGSNYSFVGMNAGDAGSPLSNSGTTTNFQGGRLATSNGGRTAFGVCVIQIFDYSATDKHKTVLSRGASQTEAVAVDANASRWANTAAVTSVLVRTAQGANYVAGSTFSLYGVIA